MVLGKIAAVVVVLAGLSARAETLVSLAPGQTKVLKVSRSVAIVTSTEQGVFEATPNQNGTVTLVGKSTGKADLQLRASNGVKVDLVVHVTNGSLEPADSTTRILK